MSEIIQPQEQEIDLLELGKKFWSQRKFIGKVAGIAAIVGIVVAVSIPKTYETTVILAPEAKSSSPAGNLGALASLAGINMSAGATSELSPQLYPDIASSTPFLLGLANLQVQDSKRGIHTTLYDYLENHQQAAWWSYVFRAPFLLMDLFKSDKEEPDLAASNTSNVISLSQKQERILQQLGKNITVTVDKKNGTTTLATLAQSPEISAALADTVVAYLQDYIIRYRTQKARQDMEFSEQLYIEAQQRYYDAQNKLASFMDGNTAIVSNRYRTTQEQLQNERDLAFTVYNQTAQQLQLARVKVQDTTPVYTVIQPAVVPLVPAAPKKKMIVVGFVFLAVLGACAWIYVKEYMLNGNAQPEGNLIA